MQISDQELRSIVREAIARHAATSNPGATAPAGTGSALFDRPASSLVERPPSSTIERPALSNVERRHASHLLLPVPAGSEGDGACVIEPTVRCSHCGYCQSLGH